MLKDEKAERIRAWRVRSGLRQEDVARFLGIPRSGVALIESADRAVSAEEVRKFAELFKISEEHLLSSDPGSLPRVLARMNLQIPDPDALKQINDCIALVREGSRLRRLLGWRPQLAVPAYSFSMPTRTIEAVEQAEAVALQERRRLGLGIRPIPDVAQLISFQGVWVSAVDLPDSISGLHLSHPEIGIAILVNGGDQPERRRFSYAHEYGHTLFDRETFEIVSSADIRNTLPEVRANAFAAAFLMPRGGVLEALESLDKGSPSRQDFDISFDSELATGAHRRASANAQRVTYKDVAMLACHFGVNYEPMCYRLKNTRAILQADLESLLSPPIADAGRRYLDLLREGDEDAAARRHFSPRRLQLEVANLAIEAFRRGLIEEQEVREIGSRLGLDRQNRQLLQFARLAQDA